MADESIEAAVVDRLRAEGHDVLAISETSPAVPDSVVLGRATREGRVLLTNDKDFADLAFLQRSASAGIVLLRLGRFRSPFKAVRLSEVVRQLGQGLQGVMTVVESHAVRRRPFPR